MRTEVTDIEQFQHVISQEGKMIIVFYLPECLFCRWYMKRLDEQYQYIDYYAVDITVDRGWYRANAELKMGFPYTRIYNEGKIIYKIDGELYPSQIKKLYSAFQK